MNVFVPTGHDQEILNEVKRWSIISLRDLFARSGHGLTYSAFCYKVRKLEDNKFVASIRTNGKHKHLMLASFSGNASNSSSIDSNGETLQHDMICSRVLSDLLKFEKFMSGRIGFDDEVGVEPDAVVNAYIKDRNYSIAIEVELHQKSRNRLLRKFAQYTSDDTYNHVLYIFKSESVLSFYRKVLAGMIASIRERIIFLLDENLSVERFDYWNSRCWYLGKGRSFESLFT